MMSDLKGFQSLFHLKASRLLSTWMRSNFGNQWALSSGNLALGLKAEHNILIKLKSKINRSLNHTHFAYHFSIFWILLEDGAGSYISIAVLLFFHQLGSIRLLYFMIFRKGNSFYHEIISLFNTQNVALHFTHFSPSRSSLCYIFHYF